MPGSQPQKFWVNWSGSIVLSGLRLRLEPQFLNVVVGPSFPATKHCGLSAFLRWHTLVHPILSSAHRSNYTRAFKRMQRQSWYILCLPPSCFRGKELFPGGSRPFPFCTGKRKMFIFVLQANDIGALANCCSREIQEWQSLFLNCILHIFHISTLAEQRNCTLQSLLVLLVLLQQLCLERICLDTGRERGSKVSGSHLSSSTFSRKTKVFCAWQTFNNCVLITSTPTFEHLPHDNNGPMLSVGAEYEMDLCFHRNIQNATQHRQAPVKQEQKGHGST